jgi:predicted lipid-binding transport protein (Tim44 family)
MYAYLFCLSGPSNQVPQQRVTSPSNARSPRNRRANHNKEQEQPKSPARTPTDAATAAAGAKAVVGSIAAASRHDAQADKKDETINDVETLVGIAESLFEEAKHDEIYQQLKLFLPTFSNEIELVSTSMYFA